MVVPPIPYGPPTQLTRNGSGTGDGVVITLDGGHCNYTGRILGTSIGQQQRSILVQLIAVGHVVDHQTSLPVEMNSTSITRGWRG